MSDKMDINEVIFELDRIDTLYDRHQDLNSSMDNIVLEKEREDDKFGAEIISALRAFRKEQDDKFSAKRPMIAPGCLATAPEPLKKPALSNPEKDIRFGAISGLVMMSSAALWMLTIIIPMGMILAPLLTFVLLISAAIWFASGSGKVTMFIEWKQQQDKWKEEQKNWEERFNKAATQEENQRFLDECKEYDACFMNLVDTCSQKYTAELKRYEAGLEKIENKYVEKLNEIGKEASEVAEKLDGITLIDSSHFYIAWRISSALKTGRADTLKEAINLAIDEQRKDDEEAQRREEARRQEEMMRRAAEEQAYISRVHNAAVEREAQMQTRAAQEQARAAQEQAKQAARQTEIADKQAREAKRSAEARCKSCANSARCTYSAKQNAGSCGGYKPR